MTRVLLFCPCQRLESETVMAIHGLQYDGSLDVMFARDNPHGEYNAQNIIHNYRKAERIVKSEGYDYLLTIENDIIPPPDALLKLMALEADISYGVYCFRRGKPLLNITRADDKLESYGLPMNLKAWAHVWGKSIECSGLGFGCTLIKSSVFNRLTFHSEHGGDGDTQLALEARKLGMKQMSDTTVICGHKRPDGVVIWPDQYGSREVGKGGPIPTRAVIPNRKIAYWHPSTDALLLMLAGETYQIDFESAGAFVNAGMAQYAESISSLPIS